MTKKQGIRAVIFLAVLIGLLWWIDKTLRFEATKANLLITRRFNEMYTDTEDTWDGILLGTSDVDRAWAAPLAYEEYGMTAYPMSTDAGPFVLIPNLIEEVLKRQDLSFVVVELHGVSDENLDTDSVKIRRVTDNMRRSANWLDTISTGMEYLEQYSPEMIPYGDSALLRLSYYFPLIQFHSRLMTDNFSWKDIDPGTTKMKGVFTAVSCYQTRRVSLTAQETYPDIQPRQQELIDAVIDCAEEHGLQLLFLNVATDLSETTQSSIAAAVRYVQEQGYPVLDLGSAEVLSASGLDGESDFFDESHLNALGAHKFTPFLAQWIEEQVELSDHRGDERYQSWEDAAENYKEWYEEALIHIRKWIKKHGIDN